VVALAVLVARVAIGLLLIVAGVLKAHDGPSATALSIAAYRILPPLAVKLLGVALPYLEIFLGAYLVLGLFTRAAAWVAAGQFVVFAGAVASLVIRQLPADCGCFGSSIPTPPSWGHVGADLVLAAVSAGIALGAPGLFAIDRRLAGDALPFAELSHPS
jgi:uncharacterized membrane protein YphA (DoxX/SURF4 family)